MGTPRTSTLHSLNIRKSLWILISALLILVFNKAYSQDALDDIYNSSAPPKKYRSKGTNKGDSEDFFADTTTKKNVPKNKNPKSNAKSIENKSQAKGKKKGKKGLEKPTPTPTLPPKNLTAPPNKYPGAPKAADPKNIYEELLAAPPIEAKPGRTPPAGKSSVFDSMTPVIPGQGVAKAYKAKSKDVSNSMNSGFKVFAGSGSDLTNTNRYFIVKNTNFGIEIPVYSGVYVLGHAVQYTAKESNYLTQVKSMALTSPLPQVITSNTIKSSYGFGLGIELAGVSFRFLGFRFSAILSGQLGSENLTYLVNKPTALIPNPEAANENVSWYEGCVTIKFHKRFGIRAGYRHLEPTKMVIGKKANVNLFSAEALFSFVDF